MAGKPIGTIYAELDLDTTKYTKGQQAILQSASSTALNVEQNWKILGQKSDVIYNAMRQGAINAFEMIKNNARSSASEIARAQEAMNAKIKEANEKQFGHQASLIETLKGHWVAASAAVIAAWALVNKAVSFMDEGGKALQVESSFKIMADSAKVNSDKLIESMKKATRETIEDSDMMLKAVKLMTLGYNPEQIERFSKVVITASQIAGTTAAEAYENLADAIGNRTPKALVRMGAVTREQMEVVNAAIKAGASEMSLFELAMANLELKQKMLQGTQDSATIALQKFHAEMKGFRETIGKGLIVMVDAAYRAFEYLAAGVLGLVSAYAQYRAFVYRIMGDEEKMRANTDVATAAWLAREELLKKAGKPIFGEEETGSKASSQELADAKKRVDNQMAALKAIADAEKNAKAAKEAADAEFAQGRRDADELGKEWMKNYINGWEVVYHAFDVDAFIFDPISKSFKKVEQLVEKTGIPGEGWAQKSKAELEALAKVTQDLYDMEFPNEKQMLEMKAKALEWDKKKVAEAEKLLDILAETNSMQGKIYGREYETPSDAEIQKMNIRSLEREADAAKKKVEETKNMMEGIGASMNSIWTSHITAMLKGTETLGEGVKGIFLDMADYAIQQITRMLMNMALFGNAGGNYTSGLGLLGSIGKMIGLKEGGIANMLPVHAYAGGGIAYGPQLGVFGEGGTPEAFVPLRNGKIPVENARGGQPIIYNDNRVTNYIDALDQKSIEDRVTGPVIRGMSRPRYADSMRNIIRRRG